MGYYSQSEDKTCGCCGAVFTGKSLGRYPDHESSCKKRQAEERELRELPRIRDPKKRRTNKIPRAVRNVALRLSGKAY